MTQLYDSTLGASAAAIDTGAGGVPQTSAHLLIVATLRTTDAAVNGSVLLRFNNDSGANYDTVFVLGANVGASAGVANAQTSIAFGVHGASGSAAEASPIGLLIPAYTQTAFNKSCVLVLGRGDSTAANLNAVEFVGTWRSTAAITRVSFASSGATLLTGSRVSIFGIG